MSKLALTLLTRTSHLVTTFQGVSDTPAWVVSQANQYARDHGKTPFVIYQGLWNVMDRAIEREIVPMCKAHGMFGFKVLRVRLLTVLYRHGLGSLERTRGRKTPYR